MFWFCFLSSTSTNKKKRILFSNYFLSKWWKWLYIGGRFPTISDTFYTMNEVGGYTIDMYFHTTMVVKNNKKQILLLFPLVVWGFRSTWKELLPPYSYPLMALFSQFSIEVEESMGIALFIYFRLYVPDRYIMYRGGISTNSGSRGYGLDKCYCNYLATCHYLLVIKTFSVVDEYFLQTLTIVFKYCLFSVYLFMIIFHNIIWN